MLKSRCNEGNVTLGHLPNPKVPLHNREGKSSSHAGEEMMRRLFTLIFALLLVVDLADDGFPGKARFVSPVSPFSDSVASFSPSNLEQLDSWCELPLIDPLGISEYYQSQTLTCRVQNNLKKITSFQLSSSGGIPL
jgi:hypothetical protein